jgi:hypothetical protein
MNIIQVHIAIEGLLDQFALPLISRSMKDEYLKISLFNAIANVLGDVKGTDGKESPTPELTSIVKQQLKEYVFSTYATPSSSATNYHSITISHLFRYIFDIKTTLSPGGVIPVIPVEYQDFTNLLLDPFDQPTISYPARIYSALVGKILWLLTPVNESVTRIDYNYFLNPVVDSGHEVLAGENGITAATAIVNTLTATYSGTVYERGTVINSFVSSNLTVGSVIYNYSDIIIPEHLYTSVIAETAMMIEGFFNKKAKTNN